MDLLQQLRQAESRSLASLEKQLAAHQETLEEHCQGLSRDFKVSPVKVSGLLLGGFGMVWRRCRALLVCFLGMVWSKTWVRSCFTKAQASQLDQKQLAELDAKLARLNEQHEQHLDGTKRRRYGRSTSGCRCVCCLSEFFPIVFIGSF